MSHVLCVLTVESVARNETARLFYGILPLFNCFVAAVIPVILVSLILMYKWFKCTHKGNSFIKKFLCDKIWQLERELQDLANTVNTFRFRKSPFHSIQQYNKLFLMENAINHQISKHLQVCTCPKSDS